MPRKFTFTTQVYDTRAGFPATGDVDVIYIDASKNTAYRYDVDYYAISSAEVDIWGAMGSLSKGGGGGGGASWGDITGTLSSQTDLQSALDAKQDNLVSGTNIKTINGSSVLGSGDLVVSGGSGLQGTQVMFKNVQGSTSFGYNASINGNSSTTAASTASRLDVYPFTPNKTLTNCSLTINVVTLGVGVLARILIYSNSNGYPTTKLYESANIDCSTIGDKTILSGFTFEAGTTYWIGYYANGAFTYRAISIGALTPIFSANASTNPTTGWSRVNTTFGTAPSTFAYNTYASTPMINIFIREV